MDTNVKASILLPVYNAASFLSEAIESIINQSFKDFEFIILNDGSNDASKDIIFSFNDARIKYVENETNLGLIKTLNKGIDLCNGKYIFRMDADDICEPQRIEKQILFMEKYPDVGVCGTWAQIINNKGDIAGKIINQTTPPFLSVSLLFTVPLVHPAVCFRASVLKKHLYHEVLIAEDFDLWNRLDKETKMANIPEFLFRYRWHDTNISKEKQHIQDENKEMLIRRGLSELALDPDDETMRIHRLSFSLYSLGKGTQTEICSSDLKKSGQWFSKLLSANKSHKKYSQQALRAFLWGRWFVLCKTAKKTHKAFFPPFFSLSPKVWYYLSQQILLLAKK